MVIEIPNVTFIKNIDAFFKEVLTKITKRYVKYLKQFKTHELYLVHTVLHGI